MTTPKSADSTAEVPMTLLPRLQSVATESRNPQAISAATSQRVPLVAHQHYSPPTALPPRNPSRLMGVIVPTIGAGQFPNLLQGIEKAASRAGFSIIMCQSAGDVLLERHHIDTLLGAQVAGILVAVAGTTTDFQHFDKVMHHGTAIVYFGNMPGHNAANAVITDDYGGGLQATRHLLGQGCARIAHLAGPKHLTQCCQRRQGYLKALADAGIAADERLICYSDLKFEDGVTAMRRLLRLPSPPTGIFGASHAVMAGALHVLKSRKIAVPRQMALVGFGNEDTYSPLVPALTSIDQLSEEMGWAAVGLLLEKVAAAGAPFVPRQVVLPSKLVLRASSLQR